MNLHFLLKNGSDNQILHYEFIKELVEIVGKHGCKMEDIIALFKQHDKNVFVEEIHNGEFDYLIRFSEENEDS